MQAPWIVGDHEPTATPAKMDAALVERPRAARTRYGQEDRRLVERLAANLDVFVNPKVDHRDHAKVDHL
jgi:hypothetical protein